MADEEEQEALLEAGFAVDELGTVGGGALGGDEGGGGARATDDASPPPPQPGRATLAFKVLAVLGGAATVGGLAGLVYHLWALVHGSGPLAGWSGG